MIQFSQYLNFEKVLKIIVISFPFTFVIGSALVNLYTAFFLIYFFFQFKNIYRTFDKSLVICPIIIWTYLVLITFFSNYPYIKSYNYEHLLKSIFYLRILILPIILAYAFSLYFNLRKKIFNTLVALTIIISLDVVFQFIFGFNIIGLESRMAGLRNSSFFGSELISGSFISKFSTLLFAFSIVYQSNNKMYEKLIFLIPLLVVCSTLLSGERMALLNTLFSFFLFFIFLKQKKYFLLLPIIFIILGFITFSSEKLKKRIIYNTSAHLIGVENSEKMLNPKNILMNLENGFHAKIFLNSFQLTRSSPIFGNGVKSFRYRCIELQVKNCSTHPHNMYMELLHDGGIMLLLLYYIYFILMLFNNFKQKINNYYNLSIIVMLIVFLNPLQITGSIFSTWYASLIFFIFSLTLFPKTINKF